MEHGAAVTRLPSVLLVRFQLPPPNIRKKIMRRDGAAMTLFSFDAVGMRDVIKEIADLKNYAFDQRQILKELIENKDKGPWTSHMMWAKDRAEEVALKASGALKVLHELNASVAAWRKHEDNTEIHLSEVFPDDSHGFKEEKETFVIQTIVPEDYPHHAGQTVYLGKYHNCQQWTPEGVGKMYTFPTEEAARKQGRVKLQHEDDFDWHVVCLEEKGIVAQ